MDVKEQLKSKSLSELFMLIRNGSGAMALSASEEIERRMSAQHLLALDGLYCQFCGELLSEHLVTEKGGHCEPARK